MPLSLTFVLLARSAGFHGTAIDQRDRAGHIARPLAQKEGRDRGEFLHRAVAADRDLRLVGGGHFLQALVLALGGDGVELFQPFRLDAAGQDGVHRDAIGGHLQRQRLAPVDQGGAQRVGDAKIGDWLTTPEEAMVRMRPQPRSRMPGSTRLVVSIRVTTMAWKCFSQSSAVTAEILPGGGPPLLFTRMSMAPGPSARPPTSRSTASGPFISTATKRAV